MYKGLQMEPCCEQLWFMLLVEKLYEGEDEGT